ncbi:hypothetical protein RJ639_039814 [Escallonia herrerae]|uniref:GAG-pre-integrase domain-containing protein n=1 Tax=Escallonia herrerae TaxID=1293975 RepID=A0AA88WI70_9ASTE|nr:hypothetical protein RJ639_039814 [Escallonia herrerae]
MNNSKTADAGAVEDNSDGVDVLSFTISSSDGGWILDTGCSYHMHVPQLKKNLISLGTLESNGCSYQGTGGVMMIMKGALVVIKGLKQNSLYLLQGSTVTGAAATTSSSDIDSDTTKLWHMRLRHMSERGMDVLSKQGLLDSEKIGKLDFYEHCVFGKHYPAYAHVNDGKLEPRAKKCIFLGYSSGVKGYRLWCPNSKSSRFLISRDVTFDESLMLSKKEELIDEGKDHGIREKVEMEVRAPNYLPIIPTDEEDGSHSTKENEEPQEQQYSIARNRSSREIRPPQKFGYMDMVAYAFSVAESIEAIKCMESEQWTVAMIEEMKSPYKNQT